MSTMLVKFTPERETTVTIAVDGDTVIRVRDTRSGQGHSIPVEYPHQLRFGDGDDALVLGTDDLSELLTERGYERFVL